jgi:hypothetical protein
MIDVSDFSAYIASAVKVGVYDSDGDTVIDGSSGCESGIHADINGDGQVDILDFSFLSINFFKNDKARCEDTVCLGSGTAAVGPMGMDDEAIAPRARISVKDLLAEGIEDAGLADFNGDGYVDLEDMALYLEAEGASGGR